MRAPCDQRNRKIIYIFVFSVLCAWGLLVPWVATASDTELFDQGAALLLKKSFSAKAEAIDKLAESGDPRTEQLLKAMLAGELYYIKKEKALVFVRESGDRLSARSALTGEDLGSFKKRKVKKVAINNNLRGRLKTVLSQLQLSSPDPDIRLAAANDILDTVMPESRPRLLALLEAETDADVKAALQCAVAMTVLRTEDGDGDTDQRLAAIDQLSGNLHPAVRNELDTLAKNDTDEKVQHAALRALAGIQRRLELLGFFETIFFGLSMGSVLVLAAIGLAITFGVIGVINMAHGELIMLGAYTAYVMQQLMPNAVGTALVLSVPVAFIFSGAVGIVIERTVIRFLYGRPLETLLATFGISLVLQQAVRSIFSPLNRSVAAPAWLSGSIEINAALSLTTNRVVILGFSLLVFAGLSLLLKKSAIGLQVRAVSQNRAMAKAMGVRAARVDALTFGLGSGIAGIAGVALSQLTNVGPNLGQAYIVDSFMVVVFGGVGNLWGTLLGGLSLGVVNKFLEPWTGAVMAKIFILFFIILFIQKRPQGLFPQKGRAAT